MGTKTQIAVTALALLLPAVAGPGAPRWRLARAPPRDRAARADTLPPALPEQPAPSKTAGYLSLVRHPPRRAGPSDSRTRWP